MSQQGNFFIKQIVKSNIPPQKVISLCDQIVETGLNTRAYFTALELSNALGKSEMSNLLLKQIQKQKEMLRPSAFWPLLVIQFLTLILYFFEIKYFIGFTELSL